MNVIVQCSMSPHLASMLAFSLGIAVILTIGLLVRGTARHQKLDRLPTGPLGS